MAANPKSLLPTVDRGPCLIHCYLDHTNVSAKWHFISSNGFNTGILGLGLKANIFGHGLEAHGLGLGLAARGLGLAIYSRTWPWS